MCEECMVVSPAESIADASASTQARAHGTSTDWKTTSGR